MRVLYLYPEEWTERRAREVHTLQTCLALADAGVSVTLATAGGFDMGRVLGALGREQRPPKFEVVNLSRQLGKLPIRSATIFQWNFTNWIEQVESFDLAYIIHLKAAPMLWRADIPYGWEAHEIFSETPEPGTSAARRVGALEQEVLREARFLVATSEALADGLNARYFSGQPLSFFIVPHGSPPPLIESLYDPRGPLVYAGSIADWKGLPLALEAAAQVKIPVEVTGGTPEEWRRLSLQLSRAAVENIRWQPRVTPGRLVDVLRSARAGLCPTLPQTGSGRYSLPMKIFDYARCGLPVVTTDLPSLRSLGTADNWCRRVAASDVNAWAAALRNLPPDGEAAREWAVAHTWRQRGERLREILEERR